jgi:hypothetical protein
MFDILLTVAMYGVIAVVGIAVICALIKFVIAAIGFIFKMIFKVVYVGMILVVIAGVVYFGMLIIK